MLLCNIIGVTFVTWLDEQLAERSWNRSELARRAGFTHSALSHIYSGARKPGMELCTGIARALNISPEVVFEKAGLLPTSTPTDPIIATLLYIAKQLPSDDVQELIDLAASKAKRHERAARAGK